MTTLVHEFWRATTPARSRREARYADIARLYHDDGLTYRQIEERLGCAQNTILRALRETGTDGRRTWHVSARAVSVKRRPRVTCARCGWLLADKPGIVEGLCALCCEDVARGVVYGGESFDDHVRWGEMVMRVKEAR